MQKPLLDIRPVAARGAEILVRLHTESWRSAYWDLLSDDVPAGVRAEYVQECLLRASGGPEDRAG